MPCSAAPNRFTFPAGTGLYFDGDELEAAFKQRPKVIFLCNPSNPCGKVFSRDELMVISGLAEKYDTFVVIDEVYEHILYEPTEYTYFSTLPGMYGRTLCCGSLSKTYSITGWRLAISLLRRKSRKPSRSSTST